MNQPPFAPIAGGYLPQVAGIGGTQIDTVFGAAAISGGTGLRVITLNAPANALSESQLMLKLSMGFATSKAGGGFTATASAISAGVFTISIWDQTVVPPVLADASVYFTVERLPVDR